MENLLVIMFLFCALCIIVLFALVWHLHGQLRLVLDSYDKWNTSHQLWRERYSRYIYRLKTDLHSLGAALGWTYSVTTASQKVINEPARHEWLKPPAPFIGVVGGAGETSTPEKSFVTVDEYRALQSELEVQALLLRQSKGEIDAVTERAENLARMNNRQAQTILKLKTVKKKR